MTRIYLIRHAEAEGNLYRRMHGHYDALVTCNGMKQIDALRKRFASIAIDACYASDLNRTCITAGAIYKDKALALVKDARFREIYMGEWEDLAFGMLEHLWPETMHCFSYNPEQWHVKNSETFQQVSQRFMEALTEKVEENKGKTIAIVSHGCAIRAILQAVLQTSDTGHSDNTAVSCIEYDNGTYQSIFLNDNSHLSDEISTLAKQNWWKGNNEPDNNLWFNPIDEDESRYLAYRKDAFQLIYGDDFAVDGKRYFQNALETRKQYPHGVCYAMLDNQIIGLIQLCMPHEKNSDMGTISFLYLEKQYRGKSIGVQLLGQAVSFFRGNNINKIQLSVSPRNAHAMHFYEIYGFKAVGRACGFYEDLVVMELNIEMGSQKNKIADTEESLLASAIL